MDVIHTHNYVLFSLERQEILSLVLTQMNLEDIIEHEITQLYKKTNTI